MINDRQLQTSGCRILRINLCFCRVRFWFFFALYGLSSFQTPRSTALIQREQKLKKKNTIDLNANIMKFLN